MSNRPSLDDYIDVAERLIDFHAKYPEGSLQTVDWSVEQVGDHTFIVYRAAAFRNPDDPRPGQGIAWEPFPGSTPFTRNSELMNAETAAWGRAIIACGLPANRHLASKQEVRNRRAEQDNGQSRSPSPQKKLPKEHVDIVLGALGDSKDKIKGKLAGKLKELGVREVPSSVNRQFVETLSESQASALVDWCAGLLNDVEAPDVN